MGMGEKPRNIQKTNTKTKEKFPVWLPFHLPVKELEADCFPVSENTENKPVWEGSLPSGAKNTALGSVWAVESR